MFELMDRPPRNRRTLGDAELDWDRNLEAALRETLKSGRAIKVSLAMFHSSPAKGRLWKEGLCVRHRVLEDREHAAAWVEPESEMEEAMFDERQGTLF